MRSFNLSKVLALPELPSFIAQVDKELIKMANSSSSSYLSDPILRLISAKGKRLRPSLVFAIVGSSQKKVDEQAIKCAVAIELVHIASLIHDDIIDKADTRWSVPTINRVEGVGRAIVAGDFLLAKAAYYASSVNAEIGKVVAAGISELCDGQSLEMADLYNLKRSQENLIKTIRNKTAALFKASCIVGGLCAGVSQRDVEFLANFGQ